MTQALKMAMKSIAGNKFRAFLTMLGIIIGVMALVILVSLVNGATGTVTDTIAKMGSDLITVRISDDKGKPITLDTLDGWMDTEGVGLIAPSGTATATGKYGATNATFQVYGATPAYEQVNGLKLLLGRFLKASDVDNHTDVCVINEAAAEKLVGYTDCLDAEISLSGRKFRVVGILEDDEDSLTAVFGADSLVAYIPYTTLLRLSSTVSSTITSFSVSAAEGSDLATAESAMRKLLMDRFDGDEDAFTLSSRNIMEDAMNNVTSILTVLLGGIAAISLIVGGIGIMNIMLVSVTERTREIGIRKALGARTGHILTQFLIESALISAAGGVIGTLLGVGIVALGGLLIGIDVVVNPLIVVIAVGFSAMVGIFFGIYPARQAAAADPIDALRYE